MDKKRKQEEDDLVWWLINVPRLGKYEEWVLDPKNKEFVDDLRVMLKEKAHIRIDLDELDKDEK